MMELKIPGSFNDDVKNRSHTFHISSLIMESDTIRKYVKIRGCPNY